MCELFALALEESLLDAEVLPSWGLQIVLKTIK